ncbi:ABC transporter substrate-binding protein [Streptomyces sp. NBC_01016]|uniref:ABC transporter substrate-binding protein n=1 Tax=Streptomyces sp. NBC_01016 TaxID=2903720 RepID=UPI00224D2B23|nr:ABC transporter substrate-binding protein [Streptomyces sp. NBC_01016]MCX4831043.1 ABC transporter substrate-binding protein [Streptomyces sp. NBC_01016]
MKRAKLLRPALTAVALALTLAACGADPVARNVADSHPLHRLLPEHVRQSGKLKIGGSTNVAPYLYRDGSEITGFEKELMDALGEELGVEIEFYDAGFTALVPGLQSGKLDVAMGDFTDTKERQQAVTFVDYTTSYQTLFVQKGNPKRLKTADDLCGTTAAATVGSLSGELAAQQDTTCRKAGRAGVKLIEMDNAAATMMQVRTGRADSVVIDYVIGRYVAEHSDAGDVAGARFYEQFHGAAVRKDDAPLRKALGAAFEEIMRNGSYERILKHWDMGQLAMDAPRVNAATS